MCLFMFIQVFFSMLEIYNEQVTTGGKQALTSLVTLFIIIIILLLFFIVSVQVVDLLSRGSRPPGGLKIREEQQRGFYVEGLRTVPCESAAQVYLQKSYKWCHISSIVALYLASC